MREISGSVCFDYGQQVLFNFFLRQRSGQPVDQLSFFKKKHRRNAVNSVLRCGKGIFIDV